MEVIRTVGGYSLNREIIKNIYNVTDQANCDSLESTARMKVSNWFWGDDAEFLETCTEADFIERCEEYLEID